MVVTCCRRENKTTTQNMFAQRCRHYCTSGVELLEIETKVQKADDE